MKLFLVALLYLAVTGNYEWVALADEAPGPQGEEGSISGQKVHKQQSEQAQKGLTKGAEGQGQPQKAAATDKGTAPSSRDGHDAQEGSHQGADEGSH